MLKQPFFIISFVLLIIIAALNNVAIYFYLYWALPWFDILMHFLGGLWIGFTAIWFFFFSGFTGLDIKTAKKIRVFYISFISAIIIGLMWEIFEIYAGGVILIEKNYPLDTATDILMDILGAIVAVIFVLFRFFDNNKRPFLTDKNG